jgi:hypothetical protein
MSTNVLEEHIASIFRVKAALLATCFHTGFLLGLFFDTEDGGDMSQKIVLFKYECYVLWYGLN